MAHVVHNASVARNDDDSCEFLVELLGGCTLRILPFPSCDTPPYIASSLCCLLIRLRVSTLSDSKFMPRKSADEMQRLAEKRKTLGNLSHLIVTNDQS